MEKWQLVLFSSAGLGKLKKLLGAGANWLLREPSTREAGGELEGKLYGIWRIMHACLALALDLIILSKLAITFCWFTAHAIEAKQARVVIEEMMDSQLEACAAEALEDNVVVDGGGVPAEALEDNVVDGGGVPAEAVANNVVVYRGGVPAEAVANNVVDGGGVPAEAVANNMVVGGEVPAEAVADKVVEGGEVQEEAVANNVVVGGGGVPAEAVANNVVDGGGVPAEAVANNVVVGGEVRAEAVEDKVVSGGEVRAEAVEDNVVSAGGVPAEEEKDDAKENGEEEKLSDDEVDNIVEPSQTLGFDGKSEHIGFGESMANEMQQSICIADDSDAFGFCPDPVLSSSSSSTSSSTSASASSVTSSSGDTGSKDPARVKYLEQLVAEKPET